MQVYLLSLLWGSSFFFYELGLESFPPLTLVALRLALGTLFLLLLFGRRLQIWRQLRAYWLRCLIFGLFSAVLPFALIAYGQVWITSSLASVLNSTMPLFTCLLAMLIGQEFFSVRRLSGIILGILGVVVLVAPVREVSVNELWGSLLVVLAALSYGSNAVLANRYRGRMDGSTMALGSVAGAAVVAAAAAVLIDPPMSVEINWRAWLGMLGLALFGTAIAFLVFFSLLTRVGSINTSVAVLLIPLSAIPVGMLLLGERPGWNFIPGMVMVLGSTIVIDLNLARLLGRFGRYWGDRFQMIWRHVQ